MNKIVFKKAEFRNFLSFGNTWSVVDYTSGMNLIQGINTDTEKSNGSGKSSTMEVIPFALFGQTIKNIKKEEIINWFNGNACEVKLYLDINDVEYMFHRSIKPNKFVVSRNGTDIPQLADVRSYQAEMEDRIIGMDFKTFKNLIYFSPNNQVSILSAKKDAKRQFLVSLFDLSIYSEMLKKVNEKMKKLVSDRDISDNDRDHYTQQIDDLERDISNFVMPDDKEVKKDLNFNTLVLEGLGEIGVEFDQDKHKRVKAHLESLNDDFIEFTNGLKLVELESKNASDKIIDLEQRVKKILDQRCDIEIKINEIEVLKPEVELKKVSVLNDKLKKELSVHKEEMIFIKESIAGITNAQGIKDAEIHFVNGQIDEVLKQSKLKESDCPTCKQKVNQDTLKIWKDQKINDHMAVLELYAKEDKTYTEEQERLTIDLKEVTDTIKDKLITTKEYTKKINSFIDMIGDIDKLNSNLDMLENTDELNIQLDDQRTIVENGQEGVQDLAHKLDMTVTDIDIKTDTFNDLEKDRVAYEAHELKITNTTTLIEQLTIRMIELDEMRKKQVKLMEEKKTKIVELNDSVEEIEKKRAGTNRLLDHLDYMKVSLKDENVKQYAISTFLPYLNQRANYYLSESGFPYTVSIDGWLDVTIRGLGVDNVSYNNVSSGEAKAIDMAIQLSCNDIVELQAKTLLNISIYDEILDSSLDAEGVKSLMDIISIRQEKNNSAVYVISHRSEIRDIEFDNHILIKKQNGFSVIDV